MAILIVVLCGCAGRTRTITAGMLGGAAVGALVGYQFVHHGQHREYETQNTLITATVFSLATGAILYWHYRELEEQQVQISGRYARYRLCNPDQLKTDWLPDAQQTTRAENYQISSDMLGSLSISLDDNTKWLYPTFRKRYLQSETSESEVISMRYIWEIIKPGSFVTRSQHPQYFYQTEEVK